MALYGVLYLHQSTDAIPPDPIHEPTALIADAEATTHSARATASSAVAAARADPYPRYDSANDANTASINGSAADATTRPAHDSANDTTYYSSRDSTAGWQPTQEFSIKCLRRRICSVGARTSADSFTAARYSDEWEPGVPGGGSGWCGRSPWRQRRRYGL